MRLAISLLVLLSLWTPTRAAEKKGFLDKTIKGADGVTAKYVVFVPHNYDKTIPTPTIFFLHGAGGTGVDGKHHTHEGIGKVIRAREKTFPFLVIFPQAQKREQRLVETWYPGHPEGDRALAILDTTMKEFNCAAKRLYLTGLSMGGFGSWKLAQAFPKWAAVAPVCGGGDPKWAAEIKHIPVWCFHGDEDSTVPVDRSRNMIDALKAIGAKPKYDEYKGVAHNSWDKAYGTDELYTWFLAHTLK